MVLRARKSGKQYEQHIDPSCSHPIAEGDEYRTPHHNAGEFSVSMCDSTSATLFRQVPLVQWRRYVERPRAPCA
jgi:hypothetical protein